MCLCGVCAGECSACRSQEGTLDFLKLELQAIVSHLTWTLGNILRSSVRAVCAFEPSLRLLLKYFYDASFKSSFLIVQYLITSVLISFDCHQVWVSSFLVIFKKSLF